MEPVDWSSLDEAQRLQLLARPRVRSDPGVRAQVWHIIDDIRKRGWNALCDHALRLDGRAPERIEVAPVARAARQLLSRDQVEAVELACRNIAAFHAAARPADVDVETFPGVRVRKLWRPIDRVGLYIPGGTSPLFSTLMMLAIPAGAAGVREIIVTTPPRPDGSLEPVLALAAELCGIESVWTAGGAQAIAALAFSAGEITSVLKVCGPGNAFVNEAKLYVSQLPGGPAIDLPAGPSELMIIADDQADPVLVAADLLAQAEHDAAAQVILITTSIAIAGRVNSQLTARLATLPRARVAAQALEAARMILADSLSEAIGIANTYAPEHLSLAVERPELLVESIINAGAVFAGQHSAESFADYLAGSSHVLPTDGAARAWSGVSVETFMKAISVQEVSETAAQALAVPTASLARLEGLEAHARAAELRATSKVAA